MKIVFFTNHRAILPVLEQFHHSGWVQAVISTDRLQGQNLQIRDYCSQSDIPFYQVTKTQLNQDVAAMLNELKPDLAVMLGFSYRIPETVFSIPTLGFYNVYFSLLPAYKGPDPVFWQIRNASSFKGYVPLILSAHMASEEMLTQVVDADITAYGASMYSFASSDPANLEFLRKFKERSLDKPNIFSLLGYEMGLTFHALLPQFKKRDFKAINELLQNQTIRSPRGERNFFHGSQDSVPLIDIEWIDIKKNAINKIAVEQGKALLCNNRVFDKIHSENVTGWQNLYLRV